MEIRKCYRGRFIFPRGWAIKYLLEMELWLVLVSKHEELSSDLSIHIKAGCSGGAHP